MAITADTIILAGAACTVLLVLGFIVSTWRAISARRALARARAELRAAAGALEELRLENHGRGIRLENQSAALGERQRDIESLRGEVAGLHGELQDMSRAYAELQTRQREREDRHQEQIGLLNETRENLKREFELLANRIFEDKGRRFTDTSSASLEALLKPFREQISGFQQRINEVHTESVKGNTALGAEIRKVLEVGLQMNEQAGNLTSALKGDKKTAGNWGEAQLERTLELAGLQAGDHYEGQAAFRDEGGRRRVPDFVIKLPDGKHLVVDSKVSLVDYDRAIAAETDEARSEALDAHARAVRAHIDDLSAKDYANLPNIGSPDFVLMFMPVEPAYIEVMKHNRDLFNHGYQKGVIMVSHTTLMPILRTVANLWMVEQSSREAREISDRAGEIYNQVCLVAERLQKLGNTLRAAQNHYNDTVTGLAGQQGLRGKVERFQQISTKANKRMPELEPLYEEIETRRLELSPQEQGPEPEAAAGAETGSSENTEGPRARDDPGGLSENIKPIRGGDAGA